MGEALESIIIARLPFRVPTAVIKFKQGFGRLIRHKDYRETILILDNRVVTKSYGKLFLDSLPECNIVADRDDVVFKAFREFYGV